MTGSNPRSDRSTQPLVTRGGRFDFWVAALTAVTTGVTFVIAILTPPKSGPFCNADCVGYPYTEIAAYIPRDFIWMYPALVTAPLFVVVLSGIHERATAARRRFGGLGVAFGLMAATLLTADYFIQVRVVQPAVIKGELEGLAPLSQYNPHGVFIALEEAGYVVMGVAFLFAALALSPRDRLHRAIRWVLITGFSAVSVLFVALSLAYGMDVEYRFEVAAITVDWTVVLVASILLAFVYRADGDRRQP